MNINLEIFESELSFDQIISIEFIPISAESTSILAENSVVTVEINLIKTKTPSKIIKMTNAFTPINISKNSKFLPPKLVKDNAMANPIKKRKSGAMKKILLFSFGLSQQKAKQTMQQVKIALTTVYFFAENADILTTIDFINQIIDGKSKIFEKAQFSNINVKLDQILKKIDSSKSNEQFSKGKKPQKKTTIPLSTTTVVKPPFQQFKSGHAASIPKQFKSRHSAPPSPMTKSIKKVNFALPPKLLTWIETLKNSKVILDVSGTEVRRKTSKTSNKSKIAERKKKRLIIILNQDILNYDPYEYKEKINSAFKTAKINVQIVTVTKSVSGKNIVMTTVESNNADQLLENGSIGNDIFKSKYVIKDETGHQFIVNYVNVERFSDMKTLQSEIETYNSIKLKFAPR